MIHNQIVICKDKEAVGKAAAEHYIALMNTKPGCVLGLATGSTPIPLYKELVALNKTGKIDFSKVLSVLTNGLRMMSVATEWQTVLTGVVVILAVCVDVLRKKSQA